MRILLTVVLILTSVLAACRPVPKRPTPAATQPLEPATEFVPGESRVPEGKYPFVEAWESVVGYSTGDECPGARMIDFPTYSFVEGRLSGLEKPKGDVIGFFGQGTSNGGAMGGGTSSELRTIEQLPFMLPWGNSVQSILEDGTVLLQVSSGQTYWLRPGQSWIEYFESDPDPTCHVISTFRLTNFGLLNGVDIVFSGTPFAPAE